MKTKKEICNDLENVVQTLYDVRLSIKERESTYADTLEGVTKYTYEKLYADTLGCIDEAMLQLQYAMNKVIQVARDKRP